MIVAAALFVAALVLGFAAPRWLSHLASPGRDPRGALTAWVSTEVLFVAALAGGPLAVATRPGSQIDHLPVPASCVRTARDEGLLPWLPYLETALWVVAGAVLVRIAVVVSRSYRRHRRETVAHLNLVRILGRIRRHAGGEVIWLQDTACAAYSIGGRNGTVVAGEGLKALDPPTRRAVLDHEYAHIRGRHHVLVAISGALRTALPFVPLCRQGAPWIRVLVELAADRRAAQSCGHDAVRDALIRCATTLDPAAREEASDGYLDARLRWLSPVRRSGRSHGVFARPFATRPFAVALSALPAFLTGVSVVGIVTASCLTV
ncbi:M56 family metallopeptidase [Rhodococcus pyridinivorans]|uniref:M56 family metallopeptidase n=1 Tax=Rhodococcus pyridinivorans TaxID=103816 RepID=UPI001E563F92|nr:M56 family metallopeptidase [Rhodococcus pyridinivorans]UGQ57660.1 M56 family metallopeptidase [Rhodococcus pyridinivorans]